MAAALKFADVTAECGEVIRAHLGLVLGAVGGIAALYVVTDLLPGKNAKAIPMAIALFYAQYHFVEALLGEYIDATQGRKRNYVSFFMSGMMGGLGIIFGMVFLIIPGIYLMGRWSTSDSLVVADGMGAVESLKASWHATEKAQWPLFFVFLVGICVWGLLLAVPPAGVSALHLSAESLPVSIAVNLSASVAVVGNWILGVAIYRCLKPSMAGLAEVFA